MSPDVTDLPTTLNPAELPLWGSRLIEASAGTGKTWTIAALYLRLVLGHGGTDAGLGRPLTPPDILVMTFTRAATRELSDRVRDRLVEAATALRTASATGEPLADAYLQSLSTDWPTEAVRQEAAWRLSVAAESMDSAAIHTIDAWCQRVLREHAFDSGVLWDEKLVADETVLRTQAVQDQWRQMCYPLDADGVNQVRQIWADMATFHKDMARLLALDPPPPAGEFWDSVQAAEHARQTALTALKARWQPWAEAMLAFNNSQLPAAKNGWNGQRFPNTRTTAWLEALVGWTQRPEDGQAPSLGAGWERLTRSGLTESRKDGELPQPIPEGFDQLARLQQDLIALPSPAAAARWWAAGQVAVRLRTLKQARAEVGFADMPQRLLRALEGPRGEALRQQILARYPVALVDEFQDTSPQQYAILDHIYQVQANLRGQALLLIGDPKQSIYAFRGADIHSYLRARRHTAGRHHVLATNHRSSLGMVAAVNHFFQAAERGQSAGAFQFRNGDDDPLPFVPVAARGRGEQWVGVAGVLPALQVAHEPVLRAQGDVREVYAQHGAEQVVSWLNDPANGFLKPDGSFQRLRPSDIAVLVRTGLEAEAVRAALRRRGVQSVYLSDRDSVFGSDEARDLVFWLVGVAHAQDPARVRAALALRTVGWPLPVLGALLNSDEAYDDVVAQLMGLHQVWREQGVLAMLRQTLYRLGLAERWVREPGGERRLTNVLHLAELLQAASADLDGEHALVRWLQARVADPSAEGDEPLVRLESDADLVQVVTVHKSKGLEYPVVCLPFATAYRPPEKPSGLWATSLVGAEGVREPVLQYDPVVRDRLVRDQLSEDVRLLYVAMTRARHGLWMGFAALRNGAGQSCDTHLGAAGHLLAGGEALPADGWWPALQAWAQGCSAVALQALSEPVACTHLQRPAEQAPLRQSIPYSAVFDRRWGIASYSRLTRDLRQAGGTLSPWAAVREDDETWDGATATVSAPVTPPCQSLCHTFRRGPVAGQFLHDQLEWLAADGFGLNRDPGLVERLQARIERAGYTGEAPGLVAWLQKVVGCELPGPGVALEQLAQVHAELEFWLPVAQLSTADVDRVCRTHFLPGLPRPELKASDLHGMLMGFADLVFAHDGRYWVLDYKSNHLGDGDAAYHPAALAGAMAHHRYDVQAAVYLLALHRLLGSRLGASYDPATHLGGAVYLFLRGVDGPAGGVCTLPSTAALLDDLVALLPPVEELQ